MLFHLRLLARIFIDLSLKNTFFFRDRSKYSLIGIYLDKYIPFRVY